MTEPSPKTPREQDVQRIRDWITKQSKEVPDNQRRVYDALMSLHSNDVFHLLILNLCLGRYLHLPAILDGTDEL